VLELAKGGNPLALRLGGIIVRDGWFISDNPE
jgi:hypothetical protein